MKEVSDDGRPSYRVMASSSAATRAAGPTRSTEDGKRPRRRADVPVADLDVKDLMLADERGLYYHDAAFDGYPAVLPDPIARLAAESSRTSWSRRGVTRAQKRVRERVAHRSTGCSDQQKGPARGGPFLIILR